MVTVNSVSGGKTSAYIAKEYPADYNVFCLVRTSDMDCQYPDKKLRQIVSDKIGKKLLMMLLIMRGVYYPVDIGGFALQN